jgi:hypothetical protein
LAEVALYTAAADQKRLAKDAMGFESEDENRTRTVTP